MTPREYETYKSLTEEATKVFITADWFNFEEGTILYGYTLDRSTFHVYKFEGEIHRHIYRQLAGELETVDYESSTAVPVEELLPSKRAYPDQTLFSFACYCKQHEFDISFTNPSRREHPLVDGEFTEGAMLYEG